MTILLKGLLGERTVKEFLFLMERAGSVSACEHIIDINSNAASSSAPSHETNGSDTLHHDLRASNSTRVVALQTSAASANVQNLRNSSLIRRADGPGRRRRSPLNSGLWISIELVLTVTQIVAAIVVLSVSRNEHPRPPLSAWIIGYASGCAATLPLLYWRWYYRNQSLESGASNSNQGSSQNNAPTALSTPSTLRTSDASQSRHASSQSDPLPNTNNAPRAAPSLRIPNPRVKAFVDYSKMILDCFFAVWFVVGNVWIFGGHSSSSEAPNLYRLCIVFLTFSCIGYAMPFLLCAAICCCLPCIISVLGFREDLGQNRGASSELINSLPTYKFKVKKVRNSGRELSSGVVEGGVVAAGTDKERTITGDDAVCCICLAKYANNDELRELPCSHFFHKDCVDKWLKINALCPLCKGEVGESNSNSAFLKLRFHYPD